MSAFKFVSSGEKHSNPIANASLLEEIFFLKLCLCHYDVLYSRCLLLPKPLLSGLNIVYHDAYSETFELAEILED